MTNEYMSEYEIKAAAEAKKKIRTGFFIFAGIVVLSLVLSSFYTIDAGERGVIKNFGKPVMQSVDEGLHWKVPIMQTVVKFDVKTDKEVIIAHASTKDLQNVKFEVALNYHPLPSDVPMILQEIGKDYEEKVVLPAVQEAFKSAVAKYSIEELTTKRQELADTAKELLANDLAKRHIIVDKVNIMNFERPVGYDNAVNEKLVAEQQKLTAERMLEKSRIESEQKVVEAQAEADSIRIQSEALKQSADVLELRWIEKWNGIMPTTYVSGDSDLMIGLN